MNEETGFEMIDIKNVAKKVIADEAAAIQNLSGFIDDDFEKVVDLIYRSKGRVIVTGIGKARLLRKNRGDVEFHGHAGSVYARGGCHSRGFGDGLPGRCGDLHLEERKHTGD